MPSFSNVLPQLRIDLVEALQLLLRLRGGVVDDVLVVDRRERDVRPPARLLHRQPVAVRLQPPLEQPVRLALLGGDEADDVLVQPGRHRLRLDVGDEAVLVLCSAAAHHRGDALDETAEAILGHAGRAQHESVAALPRLEGGGLLVVDLLGGVGDEDPVAVGCRGEAQSLEDALEERVLEIGHDHRDRVVAAVHEAASCDARRVSEVGDRGLHAPHDERVDRLLAVQHPRDGGLRDPGARGDVGDRHRTAALAHALSPRAASGGPDRSSLRVHGRPRRETGSSV